VTHELWGSTVTEVKYDLILNKANLGEL
jgi:hypothetical protein